MSLHVIEGTWEEIERHKAELIGRHLRVIVTAERPIIPKPGAPLKRSQPTAQTKVLRGRGMFAGLLSTEDYFREKREDTIREDRSLS
jgi:hypothetical protein